MEEPTQPSTPQYSDVEALQPYFQQLEEQYQLFMDHHTQLQNRYHALVEHHNLLETLYDTLMTHRYRPTARPKPGAGRLSPGTRGS
ncbi:MAG: hypothetical protein E6I32_01545 [Chloroflexi bacterium]|nr:MAG: hypothetical protein E6I32_01545 [Chloroflexota bacterium]